MKNKINPNHFRVPPGSTVKLKERPTRVKPVCKTKKKHQKLLEAHVAELSSLQNLHYASNKSALLLIFQGMDAAGKDGAIRQVMSAVALQGSRFSASNSQGPRNWNMIFSGTRSNNGSCCNMAASPSRCHPGTVKTTTAR
jgi:polyphosphate kinase 2 (PPK2 family)